MCNPDTNPAINVENNILWLDGAVKIFLGTYVDSLSSVFLLFYNIYISFWVVTDI